MLPVCRGILLSMKRTFKTVNYDQALDLTVRLGDCLPPCHLARFVVDSVALLDVSALSAHYGSRSGEPYAPEVLLGLLFYGYATGVFSSRKSERATYEAVPFRLVVLQKLSGQLDGRAAPQVVGLRLPLRTGER